jgi:hypothetical protein
MEQYSHGHLGLMTTLSEFRCKKRGDVGVWSFGIFKTGDSVQEAGLHPSGSHYPLGFSMWKLRNWAQFINPRDAFRIPPWKDTAGMAVVFISMLVFLPLSWLSESCVLSSSGILLHPGT